MAHTLFLISEVLLFMGFFAHTLVYYFFSAGRYGSDRWLGDLLTAFLYPEVVITAIIAGLFAFSHWRSHREWREDFFCVITVNFVLAFPITHFAIVEAISEAVSFVIKKIG